MADVAEPSRTNGDALVRIEASGICGSERGALSSGLQTGNAGHEACGVIADVDAASGFAPGERVGISAVIGCGVCDECRAGRETRCRRGPRIQTGMHAQYAASPLSALRRLPPSTDAATAVLLSGDGLGVPVRAARRVPSGSGDRVIVIGLGPVGLAHVAVRSHMGSVVTAIEPSPARRALALELGARGAQPPEANIAGDADLVIESTGLQACIDRAFELVAAGGTVLQSGECASAILPVSRAIVHREVTYTGAWYYAAEDHPAMLDLQQSGLRIERLITDVVPAHDAQTAFDRFFGGETGKVILRWS